MFPLELAEKLGQVDVEAKVDGGGQSGQSGAVRLGISRCLVSIVDEETVQKMRLGKTILTICHFHFTDS